ncbi:MAG: hypothetical protein V3Q69_10560 [Burkholderia sp.]
MKGIISGDPNGLRTSEVGNPFGSPEIMPFNAIASSRSIYATAPENAKGHMQDMQPEGTLPCHELGGLYIMQS